MPRKGFAGDGEAQVLMVMTRKLDDHHPLSWALPPLPELLPHLVKDQDPHFSPLQPGVKQRPTTWVESGRRCSRD